MTVHEMARAKKLTLSVLQMAPAKRLMCMISVLWWRGSVTAAPCGISLVPWGPSVVASKSDRVGMQHLGKPKHDAFVFQ